MNVYTEKDRVRNDIDLVCAWLHCKNEVYLNYSVGLPQFQQARVGDTTVIIFHHAWIGVYSYMPYYETLAIRLCYNH